MTRPEKKEVEQRIVEVFISAEGLEAHAVPGERPDCHLVFDDGRRIGLEVTELVDPRLMGSSAAMKRLEHETEALLSGCRVFVFVHWHTEAWLNPRSSRDVTTQLADYVRELMRNHAKKFGRRRMLRRRPALAQVSDVILFPDDDGPKVSATSETWVALRMPHVVQASLDEKEQKVTAYRAASGLPQWLVISTGSERAQPVLPNLLPKDHVYQSSFDRAYVLDAPARVATRLRLGPVPSPPRP